MPTLTIIRRETRDRNLPWLSVQDAYRQIRHEEWEKRQRPREIRRAAWCMATSPGCWPFWGIGFQKRWGKRAAELDYTVVPRYDEIVQEIGWYFPEYAHDNGAEELFEFLFRPYDRMPSAEEMYRQAMDRVDFELFTSAPVDDTISAFPDF